MTGGTERGRLDGMQCRGTAPTGSISGSNGDREEDRERGSERGEVCGGDARPSASATESEHTTTTTEADPTTATGEASAVSSKAVPEGPKREAAVHSL